MPIPPDVNRVLDMISSATIISEDEMEIVRRIVAGDEGFSFNPLYRCESPVPIIVLFLIGIGIDEHDEDGTRIIDHVVPLSPPTCTLTALALGSSPTATNNIDYTPLSKSVSREPCKAFILMLAGGRISESTSGEYPEEKVVDLILDEEFRADCIAMDQIIRKWVPHGIY